MDGIIAWIVGIAAAVVPGLGTAPAPSWSGYVEADYVYVSAMAPGTLAEIAVAEGQAVRRGEVLFTLNAEQHRAMLEASEARVAAAEAALENLATGGREDEIEVVRATLSRAEADAGLARETSARSDRLFAEGLVPQARYDQDRAALASAEATIRQLQAELKVAELPARDAQRRQAEASLAAARAEARKARADLAERTIRAPQDGRVERLYYAVGEMAGAGAPVLSLLPAGALKVKFYVAEAQRPALALGQAVAVACDGCAAGTTARLSYLAAEPQFTPPVIYSRDERARLTFLAEAVLEGGAVLPPGQPVTVARIE